MLSRHCFGLSSVACLLLMTGCATSVDLPDWPMRMSATAVDEAPPEVDQAAPSANELLRRIKAGETLSLEAAVRLARIGNYDLISTGHAEALAQIAYRASRVPLYPRLSANGTYTKVDPVPATNIPGFGEVSFVDDAYFEGAVVLDYTLFEAGRRFYERYATAEEVDAARQTRIRARQQVTFFTVRAWYGLHIARRQVQVIEASIPALEEALANQMALFEQGRSVRADVLLVRLTLHQRQRELERARDAVQQARWQLNRILGIPVDSPTQVAPPPAPPAVDAPVPVQPAEVLVELALQRHPALERITNEREALALRRKAAKSDYWPRIGASASYSYTTDERAAEDSQLTLAAQLNWLLLDAGSRSARIDRLLRQDAIRATEQASQQAEINAAVRDARLALLQTQADRELAEEAVTQAQSELDRERQRYDAGLATQREVLEAEARLTARKLERQTLGYQYFIDLAQLEFAMGTEVPRAEPERDAE